MAGREAGLPKGSRLTDYVSLGVLAKEFSIEKIEAVLKSTGKASIRRRDLPAPVVMYYVIAMALYMHVSCREVLRCLLEGARWLFGTMIEIRVAGRAGISQARSRLGVEPVKLLHDEVVKPIAVKGKALTTKGAWYRHWRVVSLDGSTMDVADTKENAAAFGRQKAGRGESAYPQIRFVSLVENGTHVLFGSRMASYDTDEMALGRDVGKHLHKDMLCLADRYFFGYRFWKEMAATGAALVWRARKHLCLPCLKRFRDGSYLSRIYASQKDRHDDREGIIVRVIEYRMEGLATAEPFYRLVTTILESQQAPATEVAALYHERWEIENSLDELKTHLRGAKIVLRSKRPDLVQQEFYGLMMAHFAIRGLMHEAALKGDIDPDRLSFVHAVRVIRRKIATFVALPPSTSNGLSPVGA